MIGARAAAPLPFGARLGQSFLNTFHVTRSRKGRSV
jgi:hypothetical protein